MESSATEMIHHVLLLLLFILAVGMFAGRFAALLKLPDVVLFIAAGMLIGPGLGLIHEPGSSVINQFILTAGSVLILFDGGRNLRLEGLRKVWLTVSMLSVPGVLVTVGIVGTGVHYLFGIDWMFALLVAAVIASTDPASIIPVFRQVSIRERVRITVESESAFNDATGSIVTFALLAAVEGGRLHVQTMTWDFLRTAIGGIVIGFILAAGVNYLVAHLRIGILQEYTTIAMIVVALSSYLAGDLLHVSGYMAAFAAGLIWGNAHIFGLSMEAKMNEMGMVADNLTLMMRMLIFILLGSQVNFQALGHYFWPSLGVVLILMLAARPLTVLVSALPDRQSRWSWQELLFMMWVRETGVIPAALSGIIIATGVAHGEIIASVTFMAIMLTILLQASTTAWAARRLGLEINGENSRNPA
ncbi:cation:proton antiporter [Paenibacillus sp. JX-17]|uniref:Cation:proton antiporter n=1 Tax=Paenibacillus lacisoli TaxID=3064525 RepID=A0ABT9CCP5_9BACL|nr:cation:proton antiporter [Paenibacillus sp. JX-17]MDO7907039.1 cation:proton antiporter [Paenibacillus sp. JX-17]